MKNKKYLEKIRKLVSNPAKAKYIPNFLRQEFILFRGIANRTVGDCRAKFKVENTREYNRINNLQGEEKIIENIINEVEEDDVFYDVGANIGTYSIFIGLNGSKTIAFEPLPENAHRLKENYILNQINGNVFEIALMDKTEKMSLNIESGQASEGEARISNKGDIKVQAYRGDSFIEEKNLPEPDIIKMDIEGAELDALKGLSKTLETSDLRKIYLEIHPDNIKSKNRKKRYLNF